MKTAIISTLAIFGLGFTGIVGSASAQTAPTPGPGQDVVLTQLGAAAADDINASFVTNGTLTGVSLSTSGQQTSATLVEAELSENYGENTANISSVTASTEYLGDQTTTVSPDGVKVEKENQEPPTPVAPAASL